jgi:hypothetical protein
MILPPIPAAVAGISGPTVSGNAAGVVSLQGRSMSGLPVPAAPLPHPRSAEIAAEVAARYGARVSPHTIKLVPRGVSAIPLPVWDAKSGYLVQGGPPGGWRGQTFVHGQRHTTPGGGLSKAVQARRGRVAAMHAEGATVAQIAAALDAHDWSIRQDLTVLGLPLNREKQSVAPQVLALIGAGVTCADQLAAEVGVARKTVREIAIKAGVALPPSTRRRGPNRKVAA